MSIYLFVAAEGWDIAQVVSVTRAGSNVVYSALIPWVFLAAFGMLVSEAYKVFQGSTASITGALLRIAVAVGLLTNFHDWTGEIGNAINGTVQTIGNGGGQDQLMADYAAILQIPGKSDQSSSVPFWDFIAKAGASVGDQMMRVMLWVLGAVAYALYWLMQLLQQFLLLMTIAAAPVFIGLWMLTGTRSIGVRYFLTLMSIELWPLGWALGNIVTKQMLAAVNSTGGAWLMIESTVFVVVGLWIVINAGFLPLVISKALIGGGGHALSRMSHCLSPVFTVGQKTKTVPATMGAGGTAE